MIYVARRRARDQPSLEVGRYIGIDAVRPLLGVVRHVIRFERDRVRDRDGTVRDHRDQPVLGPGRRPEAVR